jgi:hypothetical protein
MLLCRPLICLNSRLYLPILCATVEAVKEEFLKPQFRDGHAGSDVSFLVAGLHRVTVRKHAVDCIYASYSVVLTSRPFGLASSSNVPSVSFEP